MVCGGMVISTVPMRLSGVLSMGWMALDRVLRSGG